MTEEKEMTWDDGGVGGGGGNKGKRDQFLKLDNGSNELRIVTNPFAYWSHKYKKEGDPGYGRKINCSKTKENKTCPLCELGDKAKPRYFFGVISRTLNSYKIIDVSSSVFQKIMILVNNKKHYGDPTGYDIDLVVDKKADPANYYSVTGLSKSPLSGAEQKMKDEADLDELRRKASPLSYEKVKEILEMINNPQTEKTNAPDLSAKPSKSAAPAAKAPQKAAVKAPAKTVVDDDEDEDFPEYKG